MTASAPVQVVRVIDDDPSFLRAVARRLEAAGFTIEAFASVAAFLAHRSNAPGCVVLDLELPDIGGLELQEAIAREDDPLPIVFLTAHGDVQTSVKAMKRGAVDFLTKPVTGADLISAVQLALARDEEARRARTDYRELRRRFETLTGRERQVFALVARGLLNKQIAYELGTSERTIKAHRARVMQKLSAQSVADLARLADRLAGELREAAVSESA